MNLKISREDSYKIKGVAILMMIAFHTLGAPWKTGFTSDRQVFGLLASRFFFSLSICVPVYLFVSGYGFANVSDLSFRANLKRIRKVVLRFWYYITPFVVLDFLGVPFFECKVTIDSVLANYLMLTHEFSDPSWFMQPYVFSLCVLFFLGFFVRRYPVLSSVCAVLISFVIQFVVGLKVFALPWDVLFWQAPLVIGMAYGVLERHPTRPVYLLALAVVPLGIIGMLFLHDVYYKIWVGPLLAIGIHQFVLRAPHWSSRILLWLGNLNFPMWIIHVFFCWGIYRGLLPGSYGMLGILGLTLISSIVASWLLEYVINNTWLKRYL